MPEQRQPLRGEPPPLLTKRQIQICTHLVRGLSDKEIASALGISPKTAESHMAAIRAKLHTNSRVAVAVAFVLGAIPPATEGQQ